MPDPLSACTSQGGAQRGKICATCLAVSRVHTIRVQTVHEQHYVHLLAPQLRCNLLQHLQMPILSALFDMYAVPAEECETIVLPRHVLSNSWEPQICALFGRHARLLLWVELQEEEG